MDNQARLEMLNKLITRVMEREWLNKEPTPDCFDYSEENMNLMLEFSRTHWLLSPPDDRQVRTHLIDCCRCRYLYSRVRENYP